jgi:hypothetical protein
MKGREGERTAIPSGFSFDPHFEVEGWAADAPGVPSGFAGFRVGAQGRAELGHRLADGAIEAAARLVGVAEILLGVVQQALDEVVVFFVTCLPLRRTRVDY